MNRYDITTIYWGNYDRKLLAQAAAVLSKRYPNSLRQLSCAALLSWASQDHAVAQRIREQLEGAHDETYLPRHSYKKFQRWCDATHLPAGDPRWMWGAFFYSGKLAFSADSRYLWTGTGLGRTPVHLLDLETGFQQAILPGPGAAVTNLAFDERASCWWGPRKIIRGTACCCGIPRSRFLPIYIATPEWCNEFAINPQADELALAYGQTLAIYDLQCAKFRHEIDMGQQISNLVYSPNGQLLGAIGKTAAVWNVATGKRYANLRSQTSLKKTHPAQQLLQDR